MKKRKTLLAAIAVALVAILCIGGTLAYFTDYAGKATNEFSVITDPESDGYFDAVLDEPNWNSNDAVIVPGKTYAKDPTITLKDDDYKYGAYVAFTVEVSGTGSLDATAVNDLFDKELGLTVNEDGNYVATVYVAEPLQEGDKAVLFNSVTFPEMSDADLATLANFKIVVKGYAVDATEYDADTAPAALEAVIAANAAA